MKNNGKNHRVLKRFEIENYLYDKEVLTCYCRENNLEFNMKLYKSPISDISNQNVKDQTGLIKNICGIHTNINPYEFKIALSKYIHEDMEVYKEYEKLYFSEIKWE